MTEAYQALEREWAEFHGLDPACMVVCASGTAALHLSMECMGLRERRVLCPDFTMVAVPRAIVMSGRKPMFIDCGPDLLVQREKLFEYSSMDLSAAIAVHTYGRAAHMDAYHKFRTGTKKVFVVEDLAEAHGLRPHDWTDAACWSFYKNKTVHGEEGGAVYFKSKDHADLARKLRNLGFTEAHDFHHIPRGYNYRMSNSHAQLIRSSLALYRAADGHRRIMEEVYDEYCPATWKMLKRQAPWVYDFRIPGFTYVEQREAISTLQLAGIAARCAFKPMSMQREFSGVTGPETAKASMEVMYVPLTSEQEAKKVFSVLAESIAPKYFALTK